MHPPPPPPPYHVMTENGSIRPPPYRRNVPQYNNYHKKKSGGRFCIRCICCSYCCLFLLILILAGFALYFYTAYDPKVPSYKVEGLQVKAFDVLPDFSLNTVIIVNVKAENPNKDIGFTYEKDSSVVVIYKDSILCSGQLPNFYHPKKNTTMMQVELKGKSEFGSGLQEALTESRKKGMIPLLITVKVPVVIMPSDLPSKHIMVFVNCSLVVDNLAPNKKIGILSSVYTFDFMM